MGYDEVASRLRKLQKQGKLRVSDLAEWLKSKGVEVSGRPTLDKLVSAAKRSRKVTLSDLEEFIESYVSEKEEYEREIIIREKSRRARREKTRKARRKRSIKEVEREEYPIVDLALELWPNMPPKQVLARLYSVLDEIGVGYRKARNITELVAKLSDNAKKKLYEKLVELKSWREFQEEVYRWVKANVDLARYIVDSGGILEQEFTERGASGVNYRFDVYGFHEKPGFLKPSRYLVIVEAKKTGDPLGLEHILVFRGKALDLVERFNPSEAFLAIFSESGYTERSIKYVRRWGVYSYPIRLYARKGEEFVQIAETDEKYLI